MNVAISDRPVRRVPEVVRGVLRRGTKFGHYCSSLVGFLAIGAALALWLQPSWRTAIAGRIMPWVAQSTAAGSAGAQTNAGLFSAVPLTRADDAPSAAQLADPLLGQGAQNTADVTGATLGGTAAYAALTGPSGVGAASASTVPGLSTAQMGPFGAPLDPNNLPSVVRLAQPVHIVAEARYDRTTGTSIRSQAQVASYIARRYHVAQEPIDTLVHAAFQTGREVGLDPLLLLAVMAVESGFNPYAESGVGARGLMQVMPVIHSDKFDYYGGKQAALEPLPNLRVGALILKEYIGRTGTVAGGLRRYVGSTAVGDGGYGARVLAERGRLRDALRGVTSPSAPATVVASAAARPLTTTTTDSVTAHPSATLTSHTGRVHGVISSNGATVGSLKASPDHAAANESNVATTSSQGDA